MFRIYKINIITIFLCIIVSTKVNASNYVKINDLIQKSNEFNNKNITIKAEVIGEPLKRGNFTWVNANDGSNAIGIWMKTDDAKNIYKYGNYREKGDIIEVSGIYRKNCTEHGGDVDIHADSVRVMEKGYIKNEPIEKTKADIAIILMVVTILFGGIYYQKIKV